MTIFTTRHCPKCGLYTGEGIIKENNFYMGDDAEPYGDIECKCGWMGTWQDLRKKSKDIEL